MKKWEYLKINTVHEFAEGNNAKLNRLGLAGWELVGVSALTYHSILYFKREVQHTSERPIPAYHSLKEK